MILPCSTKWPDKMKGLSGMPNMFPEKIWHSFRDGNKDVDVMFLDYEEGLAQIGYDFDPGIDFLQPKIHTIREDKHDRWKPGQLIHFYINNRTKNMFQFAPPIHCVSTQSIEISYSEWDNDSRHISVLIGICKGIRSYRSAFQTRDGEVKPHWRDPDDLIRLAQNDGFPGLNEFFQWFDSDFKGKIIHWTNLRY